MNNRHLIKINGTLQTDVDKESFNKEFNQWLQTKGWKFTGDTSSVTANETDGDLQVQDIRNQLLSLIKRRGLLKKHVAKELGLDYNNFITFLTGYRNDIYTTDDRLLQFREFIRQYE